MNDLLGGLKSQRKVHVLGHHRFDFEGDLHPCVLLVRDFTRACGGLIHHDCIRQLRVNRFRYEVKQFGAIQRPGDVELGELDDCIQFLFLKFGIQYVYGESQRQVELALNVLLTHRDFLRLSVGQSLDGGRRHILLHEAERLIQGNAP